MSTRPLDLKALELKRDAAAALPTEGRSWTKGWRLVAPAIIAFGFVGLLAYAARESWLPRRSVTVAPVIVSRQSVRREGTQLFQAAGWIEPRPTPVVVSALAEGVVEKLLVVEGQALEANQPVAQLIAVDAELAVRDRASVRALRRAEESSAAADLEAAQARLAAPLHLDAALAEAESLVYQAETAQAKLPFQLASAKARQTQTEQDLAGKRAAEGAVSARQLQQVEAEAAAAQADLAELEQRGPRLKQELAALVQRRDAIAGQRKLLVEERRLVADCQAKLAAAQARLEQAEIALARAELSLARMTVRAPVAGRVLSLVARPGEKVAGVDTIGGAATSAVVTMYDPQQLQVRADVRLEDVPLVEVGQPVRFTTPSSQAPLEGVVLALTSSANIQKNTLEVKVSLHDPPAAIRPEMLVTAAFLAPQRVEPEAAEPTSALRIWIPQAIVQAHGNRRGVWVYDPAGVARFKSVQLGDQDGAGQVEAQAGLTATDKLIIDGREGLTEGARVAIAAEDATFGS